MPIAPELGVAEEHAGHAISLGGGGDRDVGTQHEKPSAQLVRVHQLMKEPDGDPRIEQSRLTQPFPGLRKRLARAAEVNGKWSR